MDGQAEDRRIYANATALATVHRVSLGEICMEYVVTGERVHSAHRGCGYKQGERWKLCEGGAVGRRGDDFASNL